MSRLNDSSNTSANDDDTPFTSEWIDTLAAQNIAEGIDGLRRLAVDLQQGKQALGTFYEIASQMSESSELLLGKSLKSLSEIVSEKPTEIHKLMRTLTSIEKALREIPAAHRAALEQRQRLYDVELKHQRRLNAVEVEHRQNLGKPDFTQHRSKSLWDLAVAVVQRALSTAAVIFATVWMIHWAIESKLELPWWLQRAGNGPSTETSLATPPARPTQAVSVLEAAGFPVHPVYLNGAK